MRNARNTFIHCRRQFKCFMLEFELYFRSHQANWSRSNANAVNYISIAIILYRCERLIIIIMIRNNHFSFLSWQIFIFISLAIHFALAARPRRRRCCCWMLVFRSRRSAMHWWAERFLISHNLRNLHAICLSQTASHCQMCILFDSHGRTRRIESRRRNTTTN